jgi:hypothetical protein
MMTSDAHLEAHRSLLRTHIERELGTIQQVFSEPGGESSLQVLHVASSVDRPVHTLITAGMSDEPMEAGADPQVPRYIELMMTLPREWHLNQLAVTDQGYWPVRTLFGLAREPQSRRSAIKWGDIVPNGSPALPYAAGVPFCGVIVAPSLLVPKEFYALESGERHVEFYAAIPLYLEEMALGRERGMQHLLATLLDHEVNDLVELKRRNVTRKKRFGLF